MSRTADWSLKYFPLDTSFFEDKRIRRLRARFGADGPMLYIYILCHAYGGEGYYIPYSEDWVEDAAEDLDCTAEKIELMLHYLLDKTLLDGTLFREVKVLSSHGIQAQYLRSKKSSKQNIEVDGRLWLLSESETAGLVKVRQISDSSEKKAFISEKKSLTSEKKATKESKLKETKLKGKDNSATDSTRHAAPSLEEICAYNIELGGKVDPLKFFDRYAQYGWTEPDGSPMDWRAKLREWTASEFPTKKKRVMSAAEYAANTKATAGKVDVAKLGKELSGLI